MTPPAVSSRDRLIVALDLPSVEQAEALVRQLGDAAGFYKIGHQLAYTGGLGLARRLIESGARVFLDLKLHDIGRTVEEGVRSVASFGATFLTVHAYPQTMRAAVAGRGHSALRLLGVTVLTSYDDADASEAGYGETVTDLVARRVGQARDLGMDGLVCAAAEAASARAIGGHDLTLVVPGIRLFGGDAGDQKRLMGPAEAIREGADYLVVGRPITAAADPRGVARAIVDEIDAAIPR